MPHVDSDMMPLEPIKRVTSFLRHIFNACVVIGGLVGGGVSIGYFVGIEQQKRASLEEIERLQKAYGQRIDRASDAVVDAAGATKDAAEAVGEIAGRVDAAASKADKAARLAAARTQGGAERPAAVQPEVVNREIRRANERLKETAR